MRTRRHFVHQHVAGDEHDAVAALRDVGGTGPVTALIGPAARGCCYEVGEEVHAHFAAAAGIGLLTALPATAFLVVVGGAGEPEAGFALAFPGL